MKAVPAPMAWQPTALTPITVGATKAAIGVAVWAAAGALVAGAAELKAVDGVGDGVDESADVGAEVGVGGTGKEDAAEDASVSALAVGDVVTDGGGVVCVAVDDGVGLTAGVLDSGGGAD